MRSLLLISAGALLLAAPGSADVTLQARGTVESNSMSSGSLANAVAGDVVTMTWTVATPGTVTNPDHGANYTVDPASFVFDAGGNILGASNPFTMLMANDNPVADGLYIFFTNIGSKFLEFEVGNGDGTFFDGVDITQEAGTLTNTMISSYSWAIHGGGSLFVDFEEVEIMPPTGDGTAYCFGDGTSTPCPCGNTGGAEEGCANSSGAGGVLVDTGTFSAMNDDLGFDAHNLLPNQPALLFSADDALNGGAGFTFGDGLRCAGTNVKRLGTMTPDANGDASWGPGLRAIGGWNGGDTRYFQAWYRDPSGSPCGADFNLTHGVEITFLP